MLKTRVTNLPSVNFLCATCKTCVQESSRCIHENRVQKTWIGVYSDKSHELALHIHKNLLLIRVTNLPCIFRRTCLTYSKELAIDESHERYWWESRTCPTYSEELDLRAPWQRKRAWTKKEVTVQMIQMYIHKYGNMYCTLLYLWIHINMRKYMRT